MKKGMIVVAALVTLCAAAVSSAHAQDVPDRYKEPSARVAADPNMPRELSGIKVPKLRPLCRQDSTLTVDRMYYDDGSLYVQSACRDGKRHGKLRVYRRDGSLWSETDYTDDVRQGTDVTYYPDGTVKQEETYTDGLRHGQRRQYYADGRPKRDSFFARGKKVSADIGYVQNSGDTASGQGVAEEFQAQ